MIRQTTWTKIIIVLVMSLMCSLIYGQTPVIVEAESGVLGNYHEVQTDGDISYLTTTMNFTGTTPDDTSLVTTLVVEFEEAGEYNLFARVNVGSGEFDDDSFFYGSDFGEKAMNQEDNWVMVNGLGEAGFSDISDWVDGAGSVGTETWKWVNLTKNGYQTTAGSPFVVETDSLSKIFQIATREDGLAIDKFAFGNADLYYTVDDLDNVLPGSESMGDPDEPYDPIDPIYKDSIYVNLQTAMIDLSIDHQKIQGFGAASPWYLSVATDSEIESAFGMDDGDIGFSIYRITVEEDSSLWSKWVPGTKKAQEMGAKIIASPWYAPDDISEYRNGETRIKLDKYSDYIDHLNTFIKYMKENGVDIYGLSVQNEPDIGDWTNWTTSEMLTLMRDYAHEIEGTKVMAPESYHFDRSYSDPILNDNTAAANTDIVCGHIYGGGLTKYSLAEEKGKEVWMTEYLMGENSSGNNIGWSMDVAENINDVMKADMNAYVWWTMIRYYGPIGDGSTAADPEDPNDVYPAKGEVTKKGFVMSQFSRFIRPGYFRIESKDISNQYVSATAYRDSLSSKIVVVAINKAPYSITQTFALQNGSIESFIPYITSPYKDCELGDEVSLVNDSLQVTLEGYSVTTFVSSGSVNIIVGVDEPVIVPESYKLYQNYPNPFNPQTNIQYFLPSNQHVKLKVYNMLGREVATLVNEQKQAGSYTVKFNASSLSSGIYFYKLTAGSFVDTKKLLLIK